MKKPMVSIIVPVYNVEPYLEQFISSIRNQIFNDFEVILVDDGSSDNSLNIIKSIAKRDYRFKVYSQNNQGTGEARNVGIKNSIGDYLLFLDPDDAMSEYLIQDNLKLIQETNADIVVFGYDVIRDGKQLKAVTFQEVVNGEITDPQTFTSYFQNGAFDTLWNKIFRASTIKGNNIQSPNWKIAQDRGLLLEITRLRPKIIFSNAKKTYYQYNFKRSGSTVATFNATAIYSISKSISQISEIFLNWNIELPKKLIYLMVVNGLYFDAGLYNAIRLKYRKRKLFIKEINNINELSIMDSVHFLDWLKTLNTKELIKLLIAKYRLGLPASIVLRFTNEKY